MGTAPLKGGRKDRRPGRKASGGEVLTLSSTLAPAFGPDGLLHLAERMPEGGTRWRITGPVSGGTLSTNPRREQLAEGAPSASPMVITTAIDLTVWPEGYFIVAAMVLGGAQVSAREGELAMVSEVLTQAAAAAPARVLLPDGRRVRVAPSDLEQLGELAKRFSSTAPPEGGVMTGRLHAAPWAVRAGGTRAPSRKGKDGYLLIPSAGHYAALQQALALNTFDRSAGSRFPRAHLDKGGSTGYAELRPITPEQEFAMAPEEAEALAERMWKHREELSDLDVDVLDAISASWLQHGPRTASERAPIYIDDLLRARGLQPKVGGHGRRGGYRADQKMDLWRCLLHLQDIWLDIADAKVIDQDERGRRTQKTRTLQSRAFVMTDRIGQRRLDGTMDVEAILVTPGEAFGRFLLGPGRQLALLSSEALRYHALRQRPEKRLARYLSWQWRVGAQHGDFLRTYRVSTLLQEIGLDANLERRPGATRERLEEALDCLQRDGLISAWQYEEGWREEDLLRKSWVVVWQELRVVVEAPDVIKTSYRRIDRQEETRALREAPVTEAAVKSWGLRAQEHRESLGLSQMVAAEQIGTSRVFLAQVERGRRPSRALEAKLRLWIEGG